VHYTSTQVIDAGGKAVFPGFIDAHSHFGEYGQSLSSVDLFGCTSIEEVVSRTKQFAAAHPGTPWIFGTGWDQNKFPSKAFPNNTLLSQAFPNTPVTLMRVDGHAMMANDKALEIAGIHTGQTLLGGKIETEQGKLTGILIDNAWKLVADKFPRPSLADEVTWGLAAQKNCFAQGLTCVADCGINTDQILTYDSLQKSGKIKMRVYALIMDNPANLAYWIPKGPYHTDRLFVKGIKAYADGALGSRGACLLAPYSDKPGWTGFLLHPIAHYDSLAQALIHTNFQLCTHAIGDSGNRVILEAYGKILSAGNDRRWRIEHAQVLAPEDINLFGQYSIIPSVQPTHATSDMYWAAERLGTERIKTAYAYHQLLSQNGWMPLGTDFPVEDISPFKTFLAAVFRVDAKGFPPGGFQKENALSRQEAIQGMTIWAARSEFEEKEIGSLEVGKWADFIILDQDLMEVSQEDVLKTKVLSTWSAGQKVYSAQ
jgi:predicted amidohydrolase YtcJ